MYRLAYLTTILLASFVLSHARHTIFINQNGVHSYIVPNSSKPGVCMTPKCVISAAGVLTSVDETVDPCDDFYRFACGGWLKRHELQEDQPEIHTVSEMQTDLNRKLKELLESKYESSEPPFVKMLKDFYNTCIDLDSIEKNGSEPLKRMLSRLGGWPVIEGDEWDESTFDWVDYLISLRRLGYSHNNLMSLTVAPKSSRESHNIIHLGVPSMRVLGSSNLTLGLDDPAIAAYFRLMMKAAKLLRANESIAENTLEKKLLEVLHFAIALENCTKIQNQQKYTPIRYLTVKELQEEVPQIPWKKYFNGMFNDVIYENEYVSVRNLDFVNKFSDLITSTEKRVIANYMMMWAVLESAEFLSEEWNSVDAELSKLFMANEDGVKPRWKKCLSSVTKQMEIALSSYCVRSYFKEESKDEAIILVKYIHKEFFKILEENDWMDEKTKEKAIEKAKAIESYIGYPNELLNDTFMMKMHENLTITTDSYLENVMASRKLAVDSLFSKLGKPFDRKADAKFKSIAQVNAFYSSSINSIVVPAGILHNAYFDKDRPNYLNFGAVGYVIGHEITHGFDNGGRFFDKDGRQVNWWDESSDKHFRKKVQCIIDQYSNYTTDIGLKINGENTQDENIADNGGIKEAYWAYNSWTKDNGIEPTLPGVNYTQNQLFWLSAAHVWCSKYQTKKLKTMLLYDDHSPGQYRIIGPMSNLEEFSNDFKCSADSPMNRKYKCKVW